jgi:16S rRNA (guanine527-N7)-methyltransferase
MFHVEHRQRRYDELETVLGIVIDTQQRGALDRFEVWLAEEAIPAGGLGPSEVDRLFDRHMADSLMFQSGLPDDARAVVDIGGGVGLPSIPLAIVRPDLSFTLVDRAQRRTDLAGRASRILGLENFSIVTDDVTHLDSLWDVALFRASLPIPDAADALSHCIRPGGTGLLAVSRQHARPNMPIAPDGITFALSREGDHALVSPFWLLEMRFS